MLASYPPFSDDTGNVMNTYGKIQKGVVTFPPHFSKDAVDLIKRLLENKPNKRYGVVKGGADNIKKHPWFRGFDWNALYAQTMTPPIIPAISNEFDTSNFDQYPPEKDDERANAYVDDMSNWDKDF